MLFHQLRQRLFHLQGLGCTAVGSRLNSCLAAYRLLSTAHPGENQFDSIKEPKFHPPFIYGDLYLVDAVLSSSDKYFLDLCFIEISELIEKVGLVFCVFWCIP